MSGLEFTDPGDERRYRRGGFRWSWRWRLRLFALRSTRWFRRRLVITAIDQEFGVITSEEQRWSWRRWRWERVEP